MTPAEILAVLNDLGDMNDYNDGLEGWLSYTILSHDTDTPILTVTWREEVLRPDGIYEPGPAQTTCWTLTPAEPS